jgi:hypothetical protein
MDRYRMMLVMGAGLVPGIERHSSEIGRLSLTRGAAVLRHKRQPGRGCMPKEQAA